MFTGIVTDIGEIVALTPVAQGQLHRLRIACRYDQATIADGASIACSGVCLTVVESGVRETGPVRGRYRRRDARHDHGEALARRYQTQSGARVKIGDELGGHIVAGHADGIASIVTRDDLPDMARFELRTTRELARFIAAKGSVTLDGVSLTVNTVEDVVFGADHSAYTCM